MSSSDSDSEEEEESAPILDEPMQSRSPSPEKVEDEQEDQELIPDTPRNDETKSRRGRKLVNKTFIDEGGFMVSWYSSLVVISVLVRQTYHLSRQCFHFLIL